MNAILDLTSTVVVCRGGRGRGGEGLVDRRGTATVKTHEQQLNMRTNPSLAGPTLIMATNVMLPVPTGGVRY
jgi:hypothetical protein